MAKSDVYFTDMRVKEGLNLLQKLDKLMDKSGMEKIDFKNKLVAVKLHFGEPGNMAYLRPNYAARIVKKIKELGGKPFLTDANTLYTGRRANAVDHLLSSQENGFGYMQTGANVIIADGLKGTEYREIQIDQEFCKTAKIGSAVADADILIVLSHFKGHELAGFGGALKNIGMGAASVGGKMEMHSTSKPRIERKNCIGCNKCVLDCAHDAVKLDEERKAVINYEKCVGCGQCVAVCQYEAAQAVWEDASEIMNKKVAEYTFAVTKDKPTFNINLIMNVTPDCDCWNNNDSPIVPDIGMAASFDPVALDKACIDLVNQAPILGNSKLSDKLDELENKYKGDKFSCIHANTNWKVGLEHGEKIGLGNLEYNLIKIK